MIGSGFRIGRLYGINIRVDWTWSLIVILISWNLTTTLGQLHPEWSPALRLGLAMLAALLFFASVLAHEMAHSLVARAQGIPVKNITLFLFGGVASIQREPKSPKDEFWMAIAGPLSSLAIAVVLLGVTFASLALTGDLSAAGLVTRLSPAGTVLLWLGSVNLILAIFNMIPGFPLDGGRVLRSILWGISGNVRMATRVAAGIGQAIAWVMIAAGIAMAFGIRIPIFGTGLVSGLWLAFIGWFLNNASKQSYQQVAMKEILDGVPVTRLMHTDPPTVAPGLRVNDFVQTRVIGNDEQAFPVLLDNHLVGIVTVEDVRKAPQHDWHLLSIRDIMTPASKLVTVSPEEDAAGAVEKLMSRDVRQLPVVRSNGTEGDEFLGLLRRRDVARWLQLHSGKAGSVSGR